MYLKALEIQGFKSFPDKTRLTFEKDITAIVGPNGSGKSNISDAILWVMGEQRSKALRGGKMEDVIFGGTEKRNKMGFAQVSLILDNSKHIFDLDNSEVMITRRYYRSGESEYYINRESVRLRDISELLMDTGLGRDGYSIIGQGRIAEIVSAKNTDRRDIFEEAAGISRYRYRKEEAERKLEKTDDNLVRINDKIEELEMQVTPLKQQAETAKKYLLLRDELRELEISVWMDNLDKLHAQAETVNNQYAEAKQELEKAHAELDKLFADAEAIGERMREKDIETEKSRETLSQMEARASECESAVAVLRTNVQNNRESVERIRREVSEQENRARGIEEQINDQNRRIGEIDAEQESISAQVDETIRRNSENTAGSGAARQELNELIAKENEKNEALAQNRTMLTMLADSTQQLMDREARAAGDTQAMIAKRDETQKALEEDKKALSQAQERVKEQENKISGYRLRVQAKEKSVQELSDRQTKLTIDARSMDSRINMLSDMEREYEGFSKAVKTVMRESERGTLKGIHGPVASLVRVDDRFALAIETALGASAQNIIVDDPNCGRAAIELLKKRDSGRGTFLPLTSIRGNTLRRVPSGEEGFLGVASELAHFDEKYRAVFENLLGRTVIAETLRDAIQIAKKYDNSFRIVSLDGQVMNAGGSMTGGSTARGTGMISRANELARLQTQREKLSADEKQCAESLDKEKRELAAVRYDLERATEELTSATETLHRAEAAVSQSELLLESVSASFNTISSEKSEVSSMLEANNARIESLRAEAETLGKELEKLHSAIDEKSRGTEQLERAREEISAKLTELREKSASLSAERETTIRTIARLEELRRDLSGDSTTRMGTIDEIESSTLSIEQELEQKEALLAQLNANAEQMREHIRNLVSQKLELEGQRNRANKENQDKNKELLDMERTCARFEQKKLAADMEEQQIVDKLWESYELSLTAAQNVRQPLESASKANRRLSEIKREIGSLGNPNLGAIDEYERVSTRYDFLTEQRDDVEKAKKELLKVISDVTTEMKEIFIREFKAIDNAFRETFLELFGGGKASLELEDEENVLDCGIEIKAQPPGKALSTISLMSGGEKSFVAIALYFAILKVRPTPFCVMDEIEAALDEANVVRYAEYMRKMCDNTQFIVITHRRGTMEEADILYGVTMQEKGVSSVLTIDLAEAEKTIG
jgi:chromosome segregation protein